MRFRIVFKDVSATELPEVIDYFAGRDDTVKVRSEKHANRFTVVTSWREELEPEADQFRRLDEQLGRLPQTKENP